ncbi:MAG TPA: aminoglycoside phosphotransferase family protein [Burkholderiaceae bacterium]|nr:aminoglycoside phosphotransferase family protein [Burkholderiaceae bacterium]
MPPSTESIPAEFARALRELGVAGADEPLAGQPLAGGVSSDIWRIDTAHGAVCAKRALPKLRVAADWRAPIARNAFEARWMQVAAQAVPGSAPRVLGQHEGLGVLVMEYLDPARHALWKQRLRDGEVDVPFARAVGDTLGRIHAYAAARPELAARFDTDAIFFDIRLEPYLLATARKHPELAAALQALVAQTQAHKCSLVHGDVSPKNILVGPPRVGGSSIGDHAAQPVLLDAECAWWGDPAFDLAFCLNHLLLKCLWVPAARLPLMASFDALARAYLQRVDWEPAQALERRAAALLPGLLLARVDGKSPVEYLTTEPQWRTVRRCAAQWRRQPVARLAEVAAAWVVAS